MDKSMKRGDYLFHELYNLNNKNIQKIPTAIFTMGIPGSGKSTTIKSLIDKDLRNICSLSSTISKKDFIELNPDLIKEYWLDYLENLKENDKKVLEEIELKPAPTTSESSVQLNYVIKYLKSIIEDKKYNIIYDGTGAQVWNYRSLMEYFKKIGYKVILLYIKTDIDICIRRVSQRKRKVEPEIIRKLFDKLNQPVKTKQKNLQDKVPYEVLKLYSDYALIVDNNGKKHKIYVDSKKRKFKIMINSNNNKK